MAKLTDAEADFIKEYMAKFDKSLDKSILQTNNQLYTEMDNMYNAFIHQFYLYKTHSYIRHGEIRPGSREGNQLYLGNDIRKKSLKNGKSPKLIINFPEEVGYDHSNSMTGTYLLDEPEMVLHYVSYGIRHPYMQDTENKYWVGSFKGKYFSYSGVMIDAFIEFEKKFYSIAKSLVIKNLRNMNIVI